MGERHVHASGTTPGAFLPLPRLRSGPSQGHKKKKKSGARGGRCPREQAICSLLGPGSVRLHRPADVMRRPVRRPGSVARSSALLAPASASGSARPPRACNGCGRPMRARQNRETRRSSGPATATCPVGPTPSFRSATRRTSTGRWRSTSAGCTSAGMASARARRACTNAWFWPFNSAWSGGKPRKKKAPGSRWRRGSNPSVECAFSRNGSPPRPTPAAWNRILPAHGRGRRDPLPVAGHTAWAGRAQGASRGRCSLTSHTCHSVD